MKIDAALIVGGKSTRFGEDKAFVDWKGKPLWVVQLKKLIVADLFSTIWLSANSSQQFPEYIDSVIRVDDLTPDIGPLGAMESICQHSQADRVLLLAVDLPRLSRDHLVRVGRASFCMVPKIDGRWEPLGGAVYPVKEMRPLIAAAISHEEYSLQKLLDLAESEGLIRAEKLNSGEYDEFVNINTRSEFESVRQGDLDLSLVRCRYQKDVGFSEAEKDFVAREEPLELKVNGTSVSVMMRSPGHDKELATGFLFTEKIIDTAEEILGIEDCPDVDVEAEGNVLNVRLVGEPDLEKLTRHVFTSSSCGVCGKATIDSVFQNFPAIDDQNASFQPEVILSLPEKLRARQKTFEKTGGLHASALFCRDGNLLAVREDVGRHNALDKIIGYGLRSNLDFTQTILLVSGRVSFELMQKALSVKIPVVCGISAPSSLAVDLASRSGQVLIGFLRQGTFNLYRPKA